VGGALIRLLLSQISGTLPGSRHIEESPGLLRMGVSWAEFSLVIGAMITAAAGRLYDCLQQQFQANRFFDVDAIEPGEFSHIIEERIRASDTIIVVIGLNWLDAHDGEGQRRR
jgi:hypothetical protein